MQKLVDKNAKGCFWYYSTQHKHICFEFTGPITSTKKQQYDGRDDIFQILENVSLVYMMFLEYELNMRPRINLSSGILFCKKSNVEIEPMCDPAEHMWSIWPSGKP